MDNASGVASLLEVAAMLKESGTKLKRSVLFAAVTGPESALQAMFTAVDAIAAGSSVDRSPCVTVASTRMRAAASRVISMRIPRGSAGADTTSTVTSTSSSATTR